VDRFRRRAERNADYFGLDEEMLRATDRFLSAWTNLPDLDKTAMQASSSPGVRVFFQPTIGWRQTDAPPKPVRPSVTGWCALNDKPNHLDPACPPKTAFRLPPEVILGGFLFGDEPPRTDVNDDAATTLYTSCHAQEVSGG